MTIRKSDEGNKEAVQTVTYKPGRLVSNEDFEERVEHSIRRLYLYIIMILAILCLITLKIFLLARQVNF